MGIETRFVILTQARTGSTRLTELLRSHPAIFCDGEIFHSRGIGIWSTIGDGHDAADEQGWQGWEGWTLATRDRDPAGFISARIARAVREPSVTTYGFKLMMHQCPAAMDAVLADPGYRIILLDRRDKLGQFASRQAALRTGQRQSRSGSKHRSPPVPFRLGFLKYCYRSHCKFANMRRHLRATGHRTLEINYENTLSQEGIQRVLDFSEIEPTINFKLDSSIQKQGSWNSAERYDRPWLAHLGNAAWKSLQLVLPRC